MLIFLEQAQSWQKSDLKKVEEKAEEVLKANVELIIQSSDISMGGPKLDSQTAGVAPECSIDTSSVMVEQTFSNALISVDCDSYEYRDCSASCIGQGAFGRVYRGIETTTGASVAIKKMPKANLKENEIKVMKAVTSKYLVALIDICMDASEYMYIIMELCDIDLEQHLRFHTNNGYLAPSDLRLLINNVTRGYYALYENNIVHRDLKPQNILITYDPVRQEFLNAKISDFGISRILTEEQGQALSNVAGTFFYMAPEVGANILTTTEYDYQVDMWSLGCVFYQCITGEVPFDECSLCRIFLFTASGNYDAYDKPVLPDDLEVEMQLLVNSLLEIDSSKRLTPKMLYSTVCKWSSCGWWNIDQDDDANSCPSRNSIESVPCS